MQYKKQSKRGKIARKNRHKSKRNYTGKLTRMTKYAPEYLFGGNLENGRISGLKRKSTQAIVAGDL